MGLSYKDLSPETRSFMQDEILHDINSGSLYLSNRLNDQGRKNWAALLSDACENYDDDWLAAEIDRLGYLKQQETRDHPTAGTIQAKVPATAHTTLAEGEFNRIYARGLCRLAIDTETETVVGYRARASASPRAESEAAVGRNFNASSLLHDLRAAKGVEPALGVPPGPNSGLSVRLP